MQLFEWESFDIIDIKNTLLHQVWELLWLKTDEKVFTF